MDYGTLKDLRSKFEQTFGGTSGLRCARAPGRVNLIGEHTDYNGGFVLPIAVDREVSILFRPVGAEPVRLWSENYGEWDEFDLDDITPNPRQPWADYIRGTAHHLHEAGLDIRPVEGIICGDVPIGAGLSSSAAIEVAAALAFTDAAGVTVDSRKLALICQEAENRFVGVNCGIMDQFVSIHARRDHALLLDCRSLHYEHLPLDGSAVRVVVCNTMVHHSLGDSAYNQRRATCENACRTLAERLPRVRQLRDVDVDTLAANADLLDETMLRRARHVVTEIDRTRRGADALRAGDYAGLGRLMFESHASLRDDYEVSCSELDLMVDLARPLDGLLGARMVGAGFGGCTVNLVRRDAASAFADSMRSAYEDATGIAPDVYELSPSAGADVKDF